MSIKLTPKDIGRHFLTRDGKRVVLSAWSDSNLAYPAQFEAATKELADAFRLVPFRVTGEGRFYDYDGDGDENRHQLDIVSRAPNQPAPLSIEVGKAYLTRDGRRVRILGRIKSDKFPFVGVIPPKNPDASESIYTYAETGRVGAVAGSPLDLVREVPAVEVPETLFVPVWAGGMGSAVYPKPSGSPAALGWAEYKLVGIDWAKPE